MGAWVSATRSGSRRRVGPWLLTVTGRRVYYVDPRPGDYCVEDIAHGLAIESRFGSQAPIPYSVAQHSCLVVAILEWMDPRTDPLTLLAALFHDSPEAYMKDLPTPLKGLLGKYRRIERGMMEAIKEGFGLPGRFPSAIKDADLRALATERRDLYPATERRFRTTHAPHPKQLRVWAWRESRARFLSEYRRLFNALGGRGRRRASAARNALAA